MERTDRIASFLDDLSPEELRKTALQAIDHAHKSAAEVAEANAKFEGAAGLIAQLRDENTRLRQRSSASAIAASTARQYRLGRAVLAVRRKLLPPRP